MKRTLLPATLPIFLTLATVFSAAAAPQHVLVVTTTTGFRHSSIETAEKIIEKIGRESGTFEVEYARVTPPSGPRKPPAPKDTGDAEQFKAAQARFDTAMEKFRAEEAVFKQAERSYAEDQRNVLADKMSLEHLKGVDAVIFANTTGDLPLPDRQGFIDWVKAGHGFVAMHSGSDTFHGFKPYIEMLGGEFQTHGAQVGVECLVEDTKHPAVKHLGESFCIEQEEIYIIKSFDRSTVHGLLYLDKHPSKKKEPGYFPVAWCKNFGEGRVFYTSLGHREDVWENKRYQQHLLGGIKWALGLEKGDATPQTR